MILPASGNGLFPQVPPFNMIHSQHKNPHHRHIKGKCQGQSAQVFLDMGTLCHLIGSFVFCLSIKLSSIFESLQIISFTKHLLPRVVCFVKIMGFSPHPPRLGKTHTNLLFLLPQCSYYYFYQAPSRLHLQCLRVQGWSVGRPTPTLV